MYFPYLRGRRSELLAFRALAKNIAGASKCLPVIEPVNDDFGDLQRAVKFSAADGAYAAVIVNPTVGDVREAAKDILDVIGREDQGKSLIGICITSNYSLSKLASLVKLAKNRKIVLIHLGALTDQEALVSTLNSVKPNISWQLFRDGRVSDAYKNKVLALGGRAVILEDKFVIRERNADYDPYPDEHYSDSIYKFKKLGYSGVGDYLTIGDRYSKGGGPAHAVTLHITYPSSANAGERSIWVRHFVSDDKTDPPKDTPGKFLQALRKYGKFYNENKERLQFSEAAEEFYRLLKDKDFPGLPKAKELSMRHHIEVMCKEQS